MDWKKSGWGVFVATFVVYAAMALYTLPRIAAEAGGLMPFDLRPGGYDFEAATRFLSALSAEGRAIYLGPQRYLDLAYPGLLALTLAWAAFRLMSRPVAVFVLGAAIAGAGADYIENGMVARLLETPVDAVTLAQVEMASFWTRMKASLTTIAMGAVVVALAFTYLQRRRARLA